MDTSKARQLVEEDAYSSRGINYNESTTVHDEHLLFDAERASSSSSSRRNDRYSDGDDDDGGMEWEPRRSADGQRAGDEERAYRRASAGGRGTTAHSRTGSTSSASAAGRGVSAAEKHRIRVLWWRAAAINCVFIGAWYTFSTCISVYNKWMFSEDHYDFPYPLFVTSCHMLVQWSLAALTLVMFPHLRSKHRPPAKDYISKVAPCGMATGLDIGLSNLSLRSITLSFYTMCKSSSLAFVLLFAFLFKLEKPTWKLVGIITIITGGVVLMVSTETQFEFAGMVEVLTASALGGLRWSLTQILLDKESMGMSNPIATLFWLAPIMGLTLSTVSMIVDGWGNVFAQEKFFGTLWTSLSTFTAILIPGLIAFLMNVTEFGLIQRTSVVTLSVAGIFKEVGTIFLSTVVFHDQLTPINISGLCVTIFGIALYNYLKYRQFTSDPEKAAKLHGGHGRSHAPPGQDAYDEDAPMLSPRAQHAAFVLGAKNDSAIFLETLPSELSSSNNPHHALGDDSDDDDRDSRSSTELPSASRNPFVEAPHASATADSEGTSLHLRRESLSSKLHQHDDDRIPGLESKIFETDDRELVELEREEHDLEASLEAGVRHGKSSSGKNETDDGASWDLLGEMDATKTEKKD